MPARFPVALVTGRSALIAHEVALVLLSHGCAVYLALRGEQKTGAIRNELPRDNRQGVHQHQNSYLTIFHHSGDDIQLQDIVKTIISDHGRIDLIIHSATISPSERVASRPFFWEDPRHDNSPGFLDDRSDAIISIYAAQHMCLQDRAMIAFTSPSGLMSVIAKLDEGADRATSTAGISHFNAARDEGLLNAMGHCFSINPRALMASLDGAASPSRNDSGEANIARMVACAAFALYQDPSLLLRGRSADEGMIPPRHLH